MIKIENVETWGHKAAIHGMRNPKNSWAKSDSGKCYKIKKDGSFDYELGPNDEKLALTLSGAGPVHGKFVRMMHIQMDVTAPAFWWIEFDTYKVGTVRDSCSKMHKIHVKPFDWDDFSHEGISECEKEAAENGLVTFDQEMAVLEWYRQKFNETQDKKYWRALIERLPHGHNLLATIDFTYEVAANIYYWRRNHKVVEWHTFCDILESLPLSQVFTCRVEGR